MNEVILRELFFNTESFSSLCYVLRMTQLLLLTSPPASGKTFWIKSFCKEFPDSVLVISPLRALADECRRQWKSSILVMTPEEWLGKKIFPSVVIFDEFHLLGYWGSSFRPVLWEVLYELSLTAELVLGLTATLSAEFREVVTALSPGFGRMDWIDVGNQKLRFRPRRYLRLPRRLLQETILHLRPSGTTLIFCPYRKDVEDWQRKLTRRGYRVWSCRGGEAAAFSLRVQSEAPPDFIVATTVLSHGVNLPEIRRIFFLYPLENIDFWIQMVARGGRRGEAFEVFALEAPHGLRWSWVRNLASVIFLRLAILPSQITDQLDQCFLKESSSTASPTRNATSS